MRNFVSASMFSILFSFMILMQFNCAREEETPMSDEDLIERGRYLVTMGGCNDCHSPKIFTGEGLLADTTRLLSGHPDGTQLPEIDTSAVQPGKWYLASSDLTAWVGPWGISYTANLTPDNPTGLGTWTDELFIKALRTGKHMGTGRPILPPMPWTEYRKLNDEDLKAIFRYLKSIPPVRNKVPDPVPPDQVASAGKGQ